MIRKVLAFGSVFFFMTSTVHAQNACGMQMGIPIFCDTFSTKNTGIPSRTGDLDPNVWGVSRATGNNNFNGAYNQWASTLIKKCDGTSPRVNPPNDVVICNGQLRQASNDNVSGQFEAGTVTVLAMYPKQPFDFMGRTGTVSFDVSNDSHGSHAAWPEFWLTDLPIPAPFSHQTSWRSGSQHSLGLKLDASADPGNGGACGNGNNLDKWRWTLGDVSITRNYVTEDTEAGVVSFSVQRHDCVISSPGPDGPLNHVEIKIAQNQIEVWASDAGTAALRKIATITNANLTLTRGLIWLEDAHYNADKAAVGTPYLSQREHTFTWDNVAFDGPFTYRDFSYDALDNNAPGPNGSVNLGKKSLPSDIASWDVLGMPSNPNPAAVRVLFNFNHDQGAPSVLNVSVNGHQHSVPWPFPDSNPTSWRTYGTPAGLIPLSDLVPGTNVVKIWGDKPLLVANVNIVLVNVPGGVPVLPGSNNAYPSGAAPPQRINGVCGSASGTTVPTIPTTNLCAVGTASSVSGAGPWTWTCAGSGGGTTVSCSANKTPAPPTHLTCSVDIAPFNVPTTPGQTKLSLSAIADCR